MNQIPNSLTVTQTGISITTSATSANSALPNANGGALGRGYYIAATAAAHVRLGVGAQTAVTTDILVQPGAPVIVNRLSANNIAAIQNAAAGVVIVTPLDD